MAIKVSVNAKGDKLTIEADIEKPGKPSASGKNLVHVTTGGNIATGIMIEGEELKLGLNAYTKAK